MELTKAQVKQMLVQAVAMLDALPPNASAVRIREVVSHVEAAEALAKDWAKQHGVNLDD